MIKIKRQEIGPMKMSANPNKLIVDAGYKIIVSGYVYEWVGITWVALHKATKENFKNIPVVTE